MIVIYKSMGGGYSSSLAGGRGNMVVYMRTWERGIQVLYSGGIV